MIPSDFFLEKKTYSFPKGCSEVLNFRQMNWEHMSCDAKTKWTKKELKKKHPRVKLVRFLSANNWEPFVGFQIFYNYDCFSPEKDNRKV